MTECIAERIGESRKGEIWHVAMPKGNPWFRPILCGEGILAPGPGYDREPTCPECIRRLAESLPRKER